MVTTLGFMNHTNIRGDEMKEKRLLSCGRPVLSYHVRVVKFNESGEAVDCAFNEVGELIVRGPSVLISYFANEEATRKAFYVRVLQRVIQCETFPWRGGCWAVAVLVVAGVRSVCLHPFAGMFGPTHKT
jgi:acyl-CoA synthetase (AMP-forming)/AMP-acid ligase II